jgi:hypothetical protein
MHHFGRGIVSTPADFGRLGDRPSHPELLDWLADEFVRVGWRLKDLHRLMMNSTAYRQTSRRNDEHEAIDPENRLLGRMPVRRLEAEAMRDAILAASGKLSTKMFGPPVPVAPDDVGQVVLGADTRDTAGRPTGRNVSLGEDEFRRSVYIQVRRTLPLSLMEAFDAPTLVPNCELRTTSTVAPQALMLMNNAFVVSQSEQIGARVQQAAGSDPAAQACFAWRLILTAEPSAAQVGAAVSFLAEQRELFTAADAGAKANPSTTPEHRALATFCQALVSSNAFLYID